MYACNQLISQISEESSMTSSDSSVDEETADVFKSLALMPRPPTSRFTGRLKFFDESKNYGFIVMDVDGTDIFVYSDDLVKTGLPREYLRTAK
jgi:hypothetical protein